MSEFQPAQFTFRPASQTPAVEPGDLDAFVVAAKDMRDGSIACFAADYLNDFPLWTDLPIPWHWSFPLHAKVDGCNATGWFDHMPDFRNEAIISPLYLSRNRKIIGWCPMSDLLPTQIHA